MSIIDDKNGKPLVEDKAVAERWREYCQELYNSTPMCANDISAQLQNKQEQEEEADITREETVQAVRRLKNGKSTGTDNIPRELMKNGGAAIIDLLLKICNRIYIGHQASGEVSGHIRELSHSPKFQ